MRFKKIRSKDQWLSEDGIYRYDLCAIRGEPEKCYYCFKLMDGKYVRSMFYFDRVEEAKCFIGKDALVDYDRIQTTADANCLGLDWNWVVWGRILPDESVHS